LLPWQAGVPSIVFALAGGYLLLALVTAFTSPLRRAG
jgi:hypothetical protein